MVIEYLTKWVKAEPLARITEAWMKDFVCKSIIYRYGIPQAIISDNGCHFSNTRFCELYHEYSIAQWFTLVGHP